MPDCFISYSIVDKELAEFVDKELKSHRITSFMASDSLQPGQNWQQEILENLRSSKWIILLASQAACSSCVCQSGDWRCVVCLEKTHTHRLGHGSK